MEEHLPFLRGSVLFRGMADDEILRALGCFRAREARFDQARAIWDIGEQPLWGLIVQGGLTAQQEDLRGNRSILGDFGPGDFLDGAMAGALPYFFSVRPGTVILLMEHEPAVSPCGNGCRAHLLFLRNAVNAMAQNGARLLHKVEYLSKRTTREKIMSYLTMQSALQGARRFNVPYARQELADLLSVDRSAMCTELTRMQNDGLIRYERKRFELLQ
ncbi:MAG: helix-turn-helix domain-containing protein [Desulfovibrionaceae bacterium]|nr:helix-turn-helix domain-containing protein [Desulfovibrionaceae bacterium]